MNTPLRISQCLTASTLVLGLVLLGAATKAHAWDIDAMNAQIEDTNVIVNDDCSGTIISIEQRLVLTAHHCIADLAQDTDVKQIDPKTGEVKTITKRKILPLTISYHKMHNYQIVSTMTYSAKVLGSDAATDVALVQIDDTDFVPRASAPFAKDSFKYKRGLKVYVVGNPLVTYFDSVTEGIISAPQRMDDFGDDQDAVKLFQVSAGIVGGNSGGAVYDDDGELIGTVTASVRGSSLGFPVPISYSKDLIKKLGFGAIIPTEERSINSAH